MMLHKKNVKDLDSWIGKSVRVLLNSESSFYVGILLREEKNGILVMTDKGRVYVPYESVLSLEELKDGTKDE
jgi:RNase P/RNase MRP subunit p29